MVLSRLVLNLDHPDVRRDLADPYEMHATLMRLAEAGGSKPLWRLEHQRHADAPVVLVQTAHAPDASVLERDEASYCLDFGSRPNILLRNLQSGDVLNFRVRANPTVTRLGKRHGLLRTEEQLAWLERQMQRAGVRLLFAQTSDVRRERMGRRRDGHPIVIHGVTFDGALEVEDAEALRNTVLTGIGHARALGFGLITLAP